jgi:membrane-associated HD superfamily phosphohydrolase
MLADTVEAATRTLKNPAMAKLERFIWELILEKVSSGQMRNSGLTFNELDIIKKIFVQILGGSFHSRIEYPNQKQKEKNNKDE